MTIHNTKTNQGNLFDIDNVADAITNDPSSIVTIDFARETHNYSLEVIEHLFNRIDALADVDRLAGIIESRWRIDVAMHHCGVTTYSAVQHKWIPIMPDFPQRLNELRNDFFERKKLEEDLQRRYNEWLCAHQQETTMSEPPVIGEEEQTPPPAFVETQATEKPQYHLSDLPQEVRDHLFINTDELYSEYVTIMRGPVKSWIDKNRQMDYNVVRFIHALRGIVSRKISMRVFALLLTYVIPGVGDQESNMKQRKDANDSKNFKYYDSADYNDKKKCWKLIQDGKDVEEMLQPVIKKLSA